MPLPPSLRLQCLSVMDQICARPIAKLFLEPVGPERDDCTDYLSIVKDPIDLGAVRKKLKKNQYNSVQAWKDDVEKVWSNSLLYRASSSLFVLATSDLQRQFRELTKFLTDSRKDNWKLELIQMHQELALCVKEILKMRSSNTQKSQRSVSKRDQLYPSLEELPPPNVRRHFQFFTQEDLLKLTNDLSSIKEESQLELIASLLKKHEPGIVDEPDQLEIDINMLKPTTLHLIRDQVDQILHR